jgi:2-iminobutanoate/2-iminopropanoate deaminase
MAAEAGLVMAGLPESIAAPGAPRPQGHYSMAVRHEGLVYVSGQLGVRPDGSHTTGLSFDEQARQALENLLAVLDSVGLGPRNILKVTAYIAGVGHWPAFNAVYAEIMGDWRPARSVVPVPELHFGYLVEVDAVAADSVGATSL